jgi:hypothetical protein
VLGPTVAARQTRRPIDKAGTIGLPRPSLGGLIYTSAATFNHVIAVAHFALQVDRLDGESGSKARCLLYVIEKYDDAENFGFILLSPTNMK